jgi:hypothetical protein
MDLNSRDEVDLERADSIQSTKVKVVKKRKKLKNKLKSD